MNGMKGVRWLVEVLACARVGRRTLAGIGRMCVFHGKSTEPHNWYVEYTQIGTGGTRRGTRHTGDDKPLQ